MRVEYEMNWRVWYVEALKQYIVSPPDGWFISGVWTIITNLNPQYFPKQAQAWDIAQRNAKKSRSRAVLFFKDRCAVRLVRDYREIKDEKVQAPECTKYLYP